jgi:hypothetical protein
MLYKNPKQDKKSGSFAGRNKKDDQEVGFNRKIFGKNGNPYK